VQRSPLPVSSQTEEGARADATVHQPIKMDADEDRKPRTMEEMEAEATWLRTFFEE
jgi:bis(5'-adenosyl)-triphosphatase